MALTEERYKAEKMLSLKNNRKCKKLEKELLKEVDKLIGVSQADFQEGVVSVLKELFSFAFERLNEGEMMKVEIGKSFGTCDKHFKDIGEVFGEMEDNIGHLKVSALINSLIIQEKIVLGRSLTMKERRGIFESVNIDYDEFTAATEENEKEAIQAI